MLRDPSYDTTGLTATVKRVPSNEVTISFDSK